MLANNDAKDVAYVFSNPLPTQNPLGDRPGDAELAKLMTSMWVSFINDLTPNNHRSKSLCQICYSIRAFLPLRAISSSVVHLD